MSIQNIIISFVIGFLICFSISGCNRPKLDADALGTIKETLPDLPEVSEPYNFPATYEPAKSPGMF